MTDMMPTRGRPRRPTVEAAPPARAPPMTQSVVTAPRTCEQPAEVRDRRCVSTHRSVIVIEFRIQ